jgi:predicted ATPase
MRVPSDRRGLRRELRTFDGDAGEAVLDRLARLVAPIEIEGAVHLLADLLSLPLRSRHPVLDLPAARRRQLTLSALVSVARSRLLKVRPSLIVEDIHWIDPSTEEFLNQLATDAEQLPLLLIVTARSDSEVKGARPARLTNPNCAAYRRKPQGGSSVSACGDTRLPSEVVHLLARAQTAYPSSTRNRRGWWWS